MSFFSEVQEAMSSGVFKGMRIGLEEDSLASKTSYCIAEMGEQYLCHPSNHVRRRTPMTTDATIQRQRRELRQRLIFGGCL